MGWKKVKEHYRIEHIVCVEDGQILIGSPYIHDIIRISPSGVVIKSCRDNEDLKRYMREFEQDPQKLSQLIKEPDQFEASLTVYTYEPGEVIEKQCEVLGWPNVTHDGEIMYENTFSTDKEEALRWAEKGITIYIKDVESQIIETSERLHNLQQKLEDLSSRKSAFLQKHHRSTSPQPSSPVTSDQ